MNGATTTLRDFQKKSAWDVKSPLQRIRGAYASRGGLMWAAPRRKRGRPN
jgi:hypothetical protein